MDNRHLQDGNYIHIVDSHVEFTRGYNQQQKWSWKHILSEVDMVGKWGSYGVKRCLNKRWTLLRLGGPPKQLQEKLGVAFFAVCWVYSVECLSVRL